MLSARSMSIQLKIGPFTVLTEELDLIHLEILLRLLVEAPSHFDPLYAAPENELAGVPEDLDIKFIQLN